MVITEKTFRLIKRIYIYRTNNIFNKLKSDKIIRPKNIRPENNSNRYIGHGLSSERYEIDILELTHP